MVYKTETEFSIGDIIFPIKCREGCYKMDSPFIVNNITAVFGNFGVNITYHPTCAAHIESFIATNCYAVREAAQEEAERRNKGLKKQKKTKEV